MHPIRWIRGSYLSSLVLALAYAAASIGAALVLRAAGPESWAVRLVVGIMGLPILLTGLLARSRGYPRWALVTSAVILAAGPLLPVLVQADASAVMRHPVGTLGYGWLYLWLVSSAPVTGPRWCASPWSVIVGSVLLVSGVWVASEIT